MPMPQSSTTSAIDASRPTNQRVPSNAVTPLHRGHDSFQAALEEALQVAGKGAAPREISLRRNPSTGSFTWTIRY